MDPCLGSFPLPPDREKPWGTGHAILVAREVIQGPFAVVNADDYYGRGSLQKIVAFLTSTAGLRVEGVPPSDRELEARNTERNALAGTLQTILTSEPASTPA